METQITIHATDQYDIFKYREDNREINKSFVDKLIKSIQRSNDLKLQPIIINSDFEVIDGQHRLEAAKTLKCTVYYVIDENFNQNKMISMNSVKINWTIDDYIHFYCTKNYPDYVNLVHFMEKYNLSVTPAFVWTSKQDSSKPFSHIKNGTFKFTFDCAAEVALKKTLNFIEKITKKQEVFTSKSRYFHRSCKTFFNSDVFDYDRFIEKFMESNIFIYSQGTQKYYFETFLNIYNHSLQDKIVLIAFNNTYKFVRSSEIE